MRRVGVAQWCLDRRGPDALFRAAALGLSVIHIEDEGPGTIDRETYLQAERETGVEIAAIGVATLARWEPGGVEHGTPSKAAYACVRDVVECAAEMNVPLVFLPSFERAEVRTGQDLANLVRLLRYACDVADGTSVLVATENTLGASGNARVVALTDHPRLRVLIDSQNPSLRGHSAAKIAEALWPHVCSQLHAKDGLRGVMGNCPLGAGESAFAQTAAAMRRLGFAGDVILENDYFCDAERRVAEDAATARRLLGSA